MIKGIGREDKGLVASNDAKTHYTTGYFVVIVFLVCFHELLWNLMSAKVTLCEW